MRTNSVVPFCHLCFTRLQVFCLVLAAAGWLSRPALAQTSATFVAPTEYATGVKPMFRTPVIVAGDFNGDGKQDLVNVGQDATGKLFQIGAALGTRNGTFAAPVITNLGPVTPLGVIQAVGAGDFNGDGKEDLLLLVGGSILEIYLGDGTGAFHSGYVFPPHAITAVAGDFTGDGKLDVAAAYASGIQVFPGKGDGTFGAAIVTIPTLPVTFFPTTFYDLKATDLNRDGKLDLVLEVTTNPAPFASFAMIPLLGSGNGHFGQGATKQLAGRAIAVADFNGDGLPDIAASVDNAATFTQSGFEVYLGIGDGTFQAPVDYATPTIDMFGLVASDVAFTGLADLFAFGEAGAGPIYRCKNLGNGTFGPAQELVAGPVFDLTFADFNGDGRLDVATANGNEAGALLLGTGGGQFAQPAAHANLGVGLFPSRDTLLPQVAFGDFNNDGTLDALLASGVLVLGTNTNHQVGFGGPIQLGVSEGLAVVSGDFNRDEHLDAAIASSRTITVLLGNGNGTFGTAARYSLNSSITSLAVGDLNGDGHLDLVAAVEDQSYQRSVAVFLGLGNGTLATPITYSLGQTATNGAVDGIVTVADLNGDGHLDIAEAIQNGTAILLGTGTGDFRTTTFVPAPTGDFPLNLLLADVNGDGKKDLVLGIQSLTDLHAGVVVYVGKGDGTFQTPVPFDLIPQAAALTFADVNGDGLPDLVGCGVNGDLGVALGTAQASFQSAQRYFAGTSCSGVYGGPINSDTRAGIATLSVYQAISISPTPSVTVVLPARAALTPAQVSIRASGLAYSRISQTFDGTVTLKNVGGNAITGPFSVVFSGLAAGVTLAHAAGTFDGSPYLALSVASLAPGQTATVAEEFSNPQNLALDAKIAVYEGSLP